MARSYKRDQRGRFATVGLRLAARREYKNSVMSSRAQLRGNLSYVKRKKRYAYYEPIGGGAVAVQRMSGTKMRTMLKAHHKNNVAQAKVQYSNKVKGLKIKK